MAWDEYGAAEGNLAGRLYPPLSGSFDNKFSDGMGGAARAELWASIAPGDPALAAKLAAEDACIDHSGDGIYAAQFLAALESTTYVICDVQELIRTGLSCIPKKSRLAAARFLSAHRPISRLR